MASSTLACATSRDFAPNQRCSTTQSCSFVSSMPVRSPAATAAATSGTGGLPLGLVLDELEPVEAARREGQQVGPLADGREARASEDLHRVPALEARQVELDVLRRPREVVYAEHDVVLVAAHVGEDAVVARRQRLVGPEAEDR